MKFFWSDAFQIAVLLNPFAVLSTFIALTGGKTVRERAVIMCRTCCVVMGTGLLVMFSGDFLFLLMGINVDVFKVGGGVVLMICAISLVWGNEHKGLTVVEEEGVAISVVPLAIPMAVGPGTMAGLMILGSEHSGGVFQVCSNIAALSVGVVVLTGVLSLGVWAEKVLSRTAISVITRLTGLFLSAIAAKMILEGVNSFLPL